MLTRASSIDDHKYVGAYCVFVRNNLVSWSSKKQIVVARSSSASKDRALAHSASEIIWLKELLPKLNISNSVKLILWCDNLSVEGPCTKPCFSC